METYAVLSPRGEPRPLCPLEGGDHRHVGHVGVRAGASRPHPSLGHQNLACDREGTIPTSAIAGNDSARRGATRRSMRSAKLWRRGIGRNSRHLACLGGECCG